MAENWADPFDEQAATRQERLLRGQEVTAAAEEEARIWPERRREAAEVVLPGLRDWIASLKPHTQPLTSRRQLRTEVSKLVGMQTAHWTNRHALRLRAGNTLLRLRIIGAWISVHRLIIAAAMLIIFLLFLVGLVIYFVLQR